jgi:hypothetical protein
MTENNTPDQKIPVAKPLHDMAFAEAEFDRMASLRDLDLDTEDMDADSLAEFKKLKRKVCKAIAAKVLTIDSDGQITVTMRKSSVVDSVTFKIRDGATLLVMDRQKETQHMHKLFGHMAALTGTAIPTFREMVDPDLGLCLAIIKLLTA